jgi:hypothetical protein
MSSIKTFINFSLIFLFGCASTPSDLIARGTDLLLQSSKQAKDVAQCIYLRWEDTPGVMVNIRESPVGFRVLLIRESELGQMVDVEKKSDGATTKFYNRHLVIGGNTWKDAVLECQ